MGGEDIVNTPDKIRKRLRLTAELVALRHGFTYELNCEPLILTFIDGGITELVRKNRIHDEIEIRRAEAGITALVEKMVEFAIASALPVLQEATFRSAKSYLCPLWPFCK